MKSKLLLTLFLMVGLTTYVFSQAVTVKGTVKDSKGEGLPGMTVFVKGTNTGTATDVNGKFAIQASNGATLLIQGIGYVAQEVKLSGQTNLDIQMKEDVTGLDEVVVTGSGEAVTKKKLGISVESLSADDFTSLPSASVDQALQGKIAGAQISSVSGQPGQQQNIILRGINSLQSNQPLIMIDGIQINTDNNFNGSAGTNGSSRLADLDLSNIERVEVIQGAAAATIYGAQGANGVIQIFTKKGVAGKPRITLSSTISTNSLLRGNFKRADKHYFATDANGNILTTGGNPMAFDATTGFYPNPQGDANGVDVLVDKPFVEQTYDPLDAVFKTAITANNSVNVLGGTDKTTYAVSVSNLNQESIMNGNLQRLNARINLGIELFKNFKLNTGSTFISSNNSTGTITGSDNVNSPLGTALLTPQYVTFDQRDASGNVIGRLQDDNSVNPLFTYNHINYDAKTTRILQNVNANYRPFKFLELDYKYGIDTYRYTYNEHIVNQDGFQRQGRTPFDGRIINRDTRGTTQNSLFTTFVRLNFQEDLGIAIPLTSSTQLAFDWRSRALNTLQSTVTGLPNANNINLNRGATPVIGQFQDEFVTYGYLVNQKFVYDDWLGISGGFRTDFSSAFGKGSSPFTFPRGDVFVRPSQLAFWNSLRSVIPEFKIRAAYGEAGIQPGAFDRIQTFDVGNIGSNSFLLPKVQQNNPDLSIQVSREFEVGTDFGLQVSKGNWLKAINTSFTYWTRNSDDVIRRLETAPSGGSIDILTNAINLEANGIQASLNVLVFENKNMSWNFITNFSRGITKVAKINNGKDIVLGGSGAGGFVLREGENVGTFFGFKALSSVNQTRTDGTRYIEAAQTGNYEVVNGVVVETATQTVQFTDEQTKLGDSNPDFNMSFINSFSFKNYLTLSFQIDWVKGNDIYNQTRQWLYRDLVHGDNTQPVTIGGRTGAFARYYTSQYNTNQPNGQFVEDGSFARLRDISLSFDFAKFFKMKSFSTLRLTLSGRNLFTITDYSGLDPEASAFVNNPAQRGLDLYAFPNFRTYSVGLTAGF